MTVIIRYNTFPAIVLEVTMAFLRFQNLAPAISSLGPIIQLAKDSCGMVIVLRIVIVFLLTKRLLPNISNLSMVMTYKM